MPRVPAITDINVLVVDDSVVVRHVVTRALADEPGVAVVGTAHNGHVALAKVESLQPDLVILDLEMPEMNGMEALAEIRRNHPKLPVVIFSHLTTQSATATIDALALGATGVALKPVANGGGLPAETVRAELLPLIHALAEPAGSDQIAASRSWTRTPQREVEGIVVGVSTGGPNALATIIGQLGANLPVPVLIVQHLPPLFTTALAKRLDRGSALSVVEAVDGEEVVAGKVFIAPGGHHMALTKRAGRITIDINDGPPENFSRPAADVLFRTAAEVWGDRVLALVMTGMGHDGLLGATAVRAAGGRIIAQSKSSSVVASMPGAIVDAGLADAVVELDDLGEALEYWAGGD